MRRQAESHFVREFAARFVKGRVNRFIDRHEAMWRVRTGEYDSGWMPLAAAETVALP